MHLLFKVFFLFRKPDETWFGEGNLRIFSYVKHPIIYRPDDVYKDDKVYKIDRYFYRVKTLHFCFWWKSYARPYKTYQIIRFLNNCNFKIKGIPILFKDFQ